MTLKKTRRKLLSILAAGVCASCLNSCSIKMSSERFYEKGSVVEIIHVGGECDVSMVLGTCNYINDFNRDGKIQPGECVGAKKDFRIDEKITVFCSLLKSASHFEYYLTDSKGRIVDRTLFDDSLTRAYNFGDALRLFEGNYKVNFKSGNEDVGSLDFKISGR